MNPGGGHTSAVELHHTGRVPCIHDWMIDFITVIAEQPVLQ